MSIPLGTRIGSYEVVAALGAGGMGEVYRARDTRLHRDVALKILPEIFASDPERLARFEREAQVLASLNHPHIAQIYGMEEGDADYETVTDAATRGHRFPNFLLDGRHFLVHAGAGESSGVYVGQLESPDMRKRFEAEGAETARLSPAQFGDFIGAETAKWTRVVKDAGIKAE